MDHQLRRSHQATNKQMIAPTSSSKLQTMTGDNGKTTLDNRPNEEQDANFASEYRQMCAKFDQLVQDQFKGEELEKLTGNFLDRHRLYLAQFVLGFAPKVRQLLRGEPRNTTDLSKLNENLEEDLRFLLAEVDDGDDENDENDEEAEEEETKDGESSDRKRHNESLRSMLSGLYRRAGQACYLRITFNKSRLKREDDRREPVGWLQLAMRHDQNQFDTCYWYMITVGRYSETVANPRDRTLAGEAFKRAIQRCLKLRPEDPLSHHLLGRYYYHIASLNWLQRTLVRSFFNFKLEGSYGEAEREFRLAHSLKDDWLPVGLWMARVLLAQNKPRDEIKYWIELALKMEVREPSTEVELEELVELGRKLKLIN